MIITIKAIYRIFRGEEVENAAGFYKQEKGQSRKGYVFKHCSQSYMSPTNILFSDETSVKR